MRYKNLKTILKKQIENNVKALWTYNEDKNEFTHIWKNYSDDLPIYTPYQLLEKLKFIEKEEKKLK